ncbi:MAG: hypothetical protein AAFX81_12125 [Pseudomonadota bacterium]
MHLPQAPVIATSWIAATTTRASDVHCPILERGIPALGVRPRCGDLTQNGRADEWFDIAALSRAMADWCGADRRSGSPSGISRRVKLNPRAEHSTFFYLKLIDVMLSNHPHVCTRFRET